MSHPILPVKSTDLVLEIGSGHNPHPRSNILCDRYLFNDHERQRFAMRYDRPLVIAEAEKLPFADKKFDFIYCSQLIEHVKDPINFAKELQRVGKAGLIITPHIIRERMFGWHYHRSMFYTKGKTLYFFHKKTDEQTPFAHYMHHSFQHTIAFQQFHQKYDNQLNIYFYWKNKINIKKSQENKTKFVKKTEIEMGQLLTKIDYSKADNLNFLVNTATSKFYPKLNKFIKNIIWKTKLSINTSINTEMLLPHIKCPNCKNLLFEEKNILTCKKCKRKYPIKHGIPILLEKKERENE